ncbi:MAG: type 4a pilus biogenesis protein PilO [Planctomycetota bacterium]
MARKTILRQKDIVIAASLAALDIAVVILIQILLITPIRSRARQQGKQNAEAVKKIEQNAQKRRDCEKLIAENKKTRSRLTAFDKRVPVKSEVPAVLEDLVRAADRHGLKIRQTKPREPVPVGGGFMRFPYQLDLRGPYHAVGQFVRGVESDPDYMEVVTVDMSAADEKGVHVQILIYLYGIVAGPEPLAEPDAAPGEEEPTET